MPNDETTVIVGIPAYNEEQNIARLLKSLLRQKQETFKLEKIIVVSDGSTDRTEERVRSIGDRRIKLIALKSNEGFGPPQNKVFDAATSDIVVLLDADVLPAGRGFLEAIIAPFAKDKKIGLVGADTVSTSPHGWFESIIAHSHELKKQIYKRIRGGNTVYLCHGRARAFSRPLYSRLRWPNIYAEDAYSYLACRTAGFEFAFARGARVFFRSPRTFADHAKQSHRFSVGKVQLRRYFPARLLENSFHIPARAWVPAMAWVWLKHPILTAGYLCVFVSTHFYWKWVRSTGQDEYEIATSSKLVALSYDD